MSFVVLDTDAASHIVRGRYDERLVRNVVGSRLAITFVTVGELTKWSQIRHLGQRRLTELQSFMNSVIVLPYSPRVPIVWGDIQAGAQLRGRPRPVNDTWVAACSIVHELPLLTFNHKDFADFAEHDGLRLLQ